MLQKVLKDSLDPEEALTGGRGTAEIPFHNADMKEARAHVMAALGRPELLGEGLVDLEGLEVSGER
ncbi:hypothetical protein OAF73_00520, partial [Planctomycetota bacterium]|nr:hypothetical protein [Planctomycetota bacterium]